MIRGSENWHWVRANWIRSARESVSVLDSYSSLESSTILIRLDGSAFNSWLTGSAGPVHGSPAALTEL